MKQKKFTARNTDGNTLELYVTSPSAQDQKEAQRVYRTAFTEAIKSGAVVRARLDEILREQGLWDDDKQIEFDTLQREILDAERTLDKGGIPLSTARSVALEMKSNRAKLRELISSKTNLDTHSAEGEAESERFNYYVYACTYDAKTNQRFFNSYDAYVESNANDAAIKAAQNLANLLYGLEEDFETKLPENEFLLKYKFVDKDLRLVDKQGRLIDSEGRLINEEGRFIDEDGNYVDKYGHSIDEEGNYKVEFVPFTDEDGNPVVLEKPEEQEKAEEQEEPPKKKRKTTSATTKE